MTSPNGQGQIKVYENGAAQPNLGAKNVAKYPISLPDTPEQKRIVKDLDLLALETQRLDSLYQRKHAALDELRQSLLHQAFSGNL
ncbi:restriction endonuclease subunit S [Dechloromonas sp. ZY10]|uniref:restriction endonuclease subunit S n=1 Tax=Dechloromonas aquae TaxID=2664436 RepID=UPI003528784F